MKEFGKTRRGFSLMELKMTVFVIAALMVAVTFYVVNYVSEGRKTADRLKLEVLSEALNRYKLLGGDIDGLTEGKPFSNLVTALKTPIYKYGATHGFLRASDDFSDAYTVAASGNGDFYTLTRYNTFVREEGGTTILSGGQDTTNAEFDVAGATYYAVAEAGYSYSEAQDAMYETRKYNTLVAAEAALPATATTPIIINILGTWAGTETNTCTFSGTTTSATEYIIVRTLDEARHGGVWSNTAYRRGITSVNVNYVTLDGLQITGSTTSLLSGSGSDFVGKNLLAYYTGTSTTNYLLTNSTSGTWYNCIAYSHNNAYGRGFGSSGIQTFVNCTAVNLLVGFRRSTGTMNYINCLAQNCPDGFSWSGGTQYNNCSDVIGDVPGANSVTGSVQFVDEGANDYHLAAGDTVARGAGADGSALFTTDIDGDTRTLPWSIGADQ